MQRDLKRSERIQMMDDEPLTEEASDLAAPTLLYSRMTQVDYRTHGANPDVSLRSAPCTLWSVSRNDNVLFPVGKQV